MTIHRTQSFWGLLPVLAALASPALAGDVASDFGLGSFQGYESEGVAREHCQGDGVVWADRKTGFYYPRFAPEYGVSPTGSFTCFKQAKKADYWGFGTSDALGSRSGRVFPFNPEPDCIWVVDKQGKGHCGSAGT